MAKPDKALDPRRWPSARYVAFSLITFGTIDLIPRIVFLYPWLFIGEVPIPAVAILVGLVLLDIATISAGIAVTQQWGFYKIFGGLGLPRKFERHRIRLRVFDASALVSSSCSWRNLFSASCESRQEGQVIWKLKFRTY